MKIRKATKKDFKEIANLMNEEFSKPPFNEKSNLKNILKSIRFFYKIGSINLAVENKKLVGVIVFKQEQYWGGPAILIEDLAIRKDFQKKGIGRLLMNDLEKSAKKKKISAIYFLTHKKSSAIIFYKKLEYKQRPNTVFFRKKLK